MNRTAHAVRVGLARGWHEFGLSVRSPQDQGFYVFMAVATLAYLFWNRDDRVEGTSLLMPSVALPSMLGMVMVFGTVAGPAFSLALEREDGTLLRARAVPRGVTGYVTGQVLFQSLQVVPVFALILLPGLLLFDGLAHRGAAGWLTVAWVIPLGLLAVMPIGIVLGALAPNAQKVGTWGMLPVFGLAAISGIFTPITALWGWVQVVAQVFPMYWIGLGMRSAFLPDAAAALEVGGSWRTWQTVAVLAAWAVAGALAAPPVLRRAARRTSGSQVEAAREAAAQLVR
ncbi:ABC transporter permease [Bailinhaonella thermotolerans]|uniref:ABC transporter permease n=1 Tax=Bailinhaonella thermotolerans TaxID=1070861 RepID=A0A3A4B6I3_9ACTN|nr:ABC transporter permease [Bailinhaonella thermotolerans]RJL34177.1 ABC transporter permease [Bailinhaonella thermotolerans]